MAQQPEQKQKESRALRSPGADYSLLLNRLEKMVLHDQDPGQALKVLQEKKIWQKLNGQHLLQWASLAQVAGAIDTALEVYEHLTVSEPELKQGWLEYLDLISLLDKKELLASRVARAAAHVSKEALDRWHQQVRQNNARESSSRDLDNIEAPFEEMIWQREAMGRFMALFSGREDVFARQWVDKNEGKSGYVPVRRAICLQDVEDHLLGRKTYGIYLLNSDNKVRCGVIDVDIVSRFRTGKIAAQDRRVLQREKNYLESRIYQMCRDLGISPLMEFSGNKGFHFWFLFERPVAAEKVKSLLQQLAQPLNKDLTAFDLEVFPKQDQLKGKGLGNLVKLPLGIHRFSGKPSFFPACEKRDMASQLHHLQGIPLISTDVLKEAARMDNAARIVMHPRIAKTAAEYPELFELEQRCPPMGQILAACRQGRSCTAREEKILLQTIGFLGQGKKLMHYLMAFDPEYNPHLVDFKLSRVRGTPLGCKRIHSLLGFVGDYCDLEPDSTGYLHPLIHLPDWKKMSEKKTVKSERVENLQGALDNMKIALLQLQRFL